MAKKFVNRHGWWGILGHGTWLSWVAIVITSVIFLIISGAEEALSALSAGVVVWLLSAVSIAVIAWAWDKARNWVMVIAMASFVAKIVIAGVLLTLIPAPTWLEPTAAAISALVSILVWQISEVFLFARTRRLAFGK